MKNLFNFSVQEDHQSEVVRKRPDRRKVEQPAKVNAEMVHLYLKIPVLGDHMARIGEVRQCVKGEEGYADTGENPWKLSLRHKFAHSAEIEAKRYDSKEACLNDINEAIQSLFK